MRRLVLFIVPAILAAMFLPLACGGGGGSKGATDELPTVSGSYGDKPTITFPDGDPSKTLQSEVLTEGTGNPVAKKDLLVADYLGQIWKGTIFDNSYDRHAPAGFQIGAGMVIPGWDEALVGQKEGSRVLLVVPPDKGYGSEGKQEAGIKGTDTLVFVVDVVRRYDSAAAGDPKATPKPAPKGTPIVTGDLGKQPTVKIKGAKEPKKAENFVLASGKGKKLTAGGFAVLQYEAVGWDGKPVGSTWKDGVPAGVALGNTQQPTPFDSLVGVPIGSRVLLELPPQPGQAGATSIAVAVDIVDETGTAKETAAQ